VDKRGINVRKSIDDIIGSQMSLDDEEMERKYEDEEDVVMYMP
jgi:hypothetical protein